LETLFSLIVGMVFLIVGFKALFHKPPRSPRIMRFLIIFMGVGFILYFPHKVVWAK
jgi:hypothetical protein